MNENVNMQTVEIFDRAKISVSKVKSVDAFSDTQINLTLESSALIIHGANLKITSFSASSGAFSAEGRVDKALFKDKGASILKGIFK